MITNDSEDEIRSVNITFLEIEDDSRNYTLAVTMGLLKTTEDAVNLGFPDHVKFLKGYYTLEIKEEGFPNFLANISIDFHISSRSQLGPITSEILENVRLLRREAGGYHWEVQQIIEGKPEIVDEKKGLYRINVEVNSFGDFVVLLAQAELIVKEIRPGANPAFVGQTMRISVVVCNGGAFPERTAENVNVKLFCIDGSLVEYLGEVEFGSIDPNIDYHPERTDIGEGEKEGSITWNTHEIRDIGVKINITLVARIDPDGYVREVDEINNEVNITIEVIKLGGCPYYPEHYQEKDITGPLIISLILALCILPITYYLIWRCVKK